jgi:hypothetical protein
MPVHDWTRVDPGIFHAFHTVWIGQLQTALNRGRLPRGFYALAEQHAGSAIADVLTLHTGDTDPEPNAGGPTSWDTGGGTAAAVATARPRTRQRQRLVIPPEKTRPRSLAVRHVSGHRLVALVEIVSPSNKDRRDSVAAFIDKVASALRAGVNVLVADLFPPGPHDPEGMHGALLSRLPAETAEGAAPSPFRVPADEPMTLAAYSAGPPIDAYLEHSAAGRPLPAMPLFLGSGRYIDAPLDETYRASADGLPEFWREVLERGRPTRP